MFSSVFFFLYGSNIQHEHFSPAPAVGIESSSHSAHQVNDFTGELWKRAALDDLARQEKQKQWLGSREKQLQVRNTRRLSVYLGKSGFSNFSSAFFIFSQWFWLGRESTCAEIQCLAPQEEGMWKQNCRPQGFQVHNMTRSHIFFLLFQQPKKPSKHQ